VHTPLFKQLEALSVFVWTRNSRGKNLLATSQCAVEEILALGKIEELRDLLVNVSRT
jgi:hypothetical protein